MPVKVYKPSDFPKPRADKFRDELFAKVAKVLESGEYERVQSDDSTVQVAIQLVIEDTKPRYTGENLIDFQTNYASQGGWKRVTTSRSPKTGYTILVTLEA